MQTLSVDHSQGTLSPPSARPLIPVELSCLSGGTRTQDVVASGASAGHRPDPCPGRLGPRSALGGDILGENIATDDDATKMLPMHSSHEREGNQGTYRCR